MEIFQEIEAKTMKKHKNKNGTPRQIYNFFLLYLYLF